MKSQLYRRILWVCCVVFLVTAACSLPTLQQTQQPNSAQTMAVRTIDAMMTEISGSSTTATSAPNQPATGADATATVTAPTLRPSSTPEPTATQFILPTATATPICDQAGFISDVTVADGTNIIAGSTFVKTWRLRNNGTCTWTPDYAIVFDSGDAMSGPAAQKIGVSVPPGQTVDVSVTFTAPSTPGKYRSNYRMRNAAGVLFGIGSNSGKFYVEINTVPAVVSGSGLDFTALYCSAEWTGNSKLLPCLGAEGSADGFVVYLARPVLETGYVDDEPALLTNPPRVDNGVIRGKYPAYTVKDKDHFMALLTCQNGAKNCNVRMQLDYQVDNGAIQTLAAWDVKVDDQFDKVDLDLSGMANQKIKFILTVLANGASDNDRAVWLAPRIVNKP